MIFTCHKCQKENTYEGPLGRRDECSHCGSDARVCLNCEYYDISAHHACRENQAEWVREKDAGNFCGYFEPTKKGCNPFTAEKDPLEALKSLFKKN